MLSSIPHKYNFYLNFNNYYESYKHFSRKDRNARSHNSRYIKKKSNTHYFYYIYIYLSNIISKSIPNSSYLPNTLNTPPCHETSPNFNALIPVQSAITRAAIKVTKRSIIRARRQPTLAPSLSITPRNSSPDRAKLPFDHETTDTIPVPRDPRD